MQSIFKHINEYNFDNGLKLIVKEDHRCALAIFQIFYRVGSSYETTGVTGISHLLEHMMFRGTPTFPKEKFLETIANLGGMQNAQTGQDFTSYNEILNSAHIEVCFKFESDRMKQLSFDQEDINKEKHIVINERDQEQANPKKYLRERLFSVAFANSTYRHPIIGWPIDLETIDSSILRKWYRTWYSPNNATIVVVGDVSAKKISQLARKYFAQLLPKRLPKPPILASENYEGQRSVTIYRHTHLSHLMIGFNVPVILTALQDWESYALFLLAELLAGGKYARLQTSLIEKNNLAVNVNYEYSPFKRFDTVLLLQVMLRKSDFTLAHELIENELANIKKHGPNKRELELLKVQLMASQIYQEESIASQAYELGSFESVGLGWHGVEKAHGKIQKITPEHIKEVAIKYLKSANASMAYLIPEGEE